MATMKFYNVTAVPTISSDEGTYYVKDANGYVQEYLVTGGLVKYIGGYPMQDMGTDVEKPMSQKAVTDELALKAEQTELVQFRSDLNETDYKIGELTGSINSQIASSGVIIDPLNIKAGEKIYFKLDGTQTASRVIVRGNVFVGGAGTILIYDKPALGTWLEWTATGDVSKIGLWYDGPIDLKMTLLLNMSKNIKDVVDKSNSNETYINIINEKIGSQKFNKSFVPKNFGNTLTQYSLGIQRKIADSINNIRLVGDWDIEGYYYVSYLKKNGINNRIIIRQIIDGVGVIVLSRYSSDLYPNRYDRDPNGAIVAGNYIYADVDWENIDELNLLGDLPRYYINNNCIENRSSIKKEIDKGDGLIYSDKITSTVEGNRVIINCNIKENAPFRFKLSGRLNYGRLLVFANGSRYSDPGVFLIKEIQASTVNVISETWFDYNLPHAEINKFGLYYIPVDAITDVQLSVLTPDNSIVIHEEIDKIKSDLSEISQNYVNDGDLTIKNVDFVHGNNWFNYDCPPDLVSERTVLDKIANKGFICFRTDDNTPPQVSVMKKLVKITDYFGYRYSMSINTAASWATDEQIQFFRTLQMRGYEICDHTPNNQTRYVDILTEWKPIFEPYIGSGIKKIIPNPTISGRWMVGLEYFSNVDYSLVQYGLSNSYQTVAGTNTIQGDFTVPSSNPEHLGIATLSMDGSLFGEQILYAYIENANGEVGRGWNLVKTKNATSIGLVDIFGNNINFSGNQNITLYLMVQRINNSVGNIELTEAATYCLLLAGQMWFAYRGLNKPKTWVQVGGKHPYASRIGLQKAILKLGMDCAETIQYNKQITYNCMHDEQYPNACTWWGSDNLHFDSKNESILSSVKLAIASAVALKKLISIASHHVYPNFSGSTTDGKEQSYLKFMYDLFSFLKTEKVPIITLSQRSRLVIENHLDQFDNVMPPLYIDRTNRGFPDGYLTNVISTYNTDDGLAESQQCAFQFSGAGANASSDRVLYIKELGGLTKGKNKFYAYVDGNCNLTVTISDAYRYFNLAQSSLIFSSGWNKKEIVFDIPVDTNFITIDVRLNSTIPSGENRIMSNIGIVKVLE